MKGTDLTEARKLARSTFPCICIGNRMGASKIKD